MAWKAQDSMVRRLLPQLLGTFLISLFLANRLGSAISDVSFLVPMACLSMLFVAPITIQTGSFWKSVLIASGMMWASIALSLAWSGAPVPNHEAVAWAIGCSLGLASATAGLTLLLIQRMKWRPNVVIWVMRGIMLALFFAYRAWMV